MIKEGNKEESKQGGDNLFWFTIFKGLVPGQVNIYNYRGSDRECMLELSHLSDLKTFHQDHLLKF